VHREWVVRVVLENDQSTTRANDSVEFFEKVGMFGVRNVMQNTRHEYQVKTIVGKRELRAIEVHEVGVPGKCRSTDFQALLRDVQTREAAARHVLAKVRHRRADPGTEVQDRRLGGESAGREQRGHIRNLVLGEVLRTFTRQSDVFCVQLPVLIGEPVEFRCIHRI
jgi:hypothetical protein